MFTRREDTAEMYGYAPLDSAASQTQVQSLMSTVNMTRLLLALLVFTVPISPPVFLRWLTKSGEFSSQ